MPPKFIQQDKGYNMVPVYFQVKTKEKAPDPELWLIYNNNNDI